LERDLKTKPHADEPTRKRDRKRSDQLAE